MEPLSVSSYSHMAFRVRSLESSRAFYARLFGYDPFIETPLEHAALGKLTGGVTSKAVLAMGLLGDKVLELVEYDGLPAEQLGFSHFALRVADLDETYRRARELDAPILVEPVDIEGTRVMFIEDPDGNRFEIGEFAEWPQAETDARESDPARRVVDFFAALATCDPAQVLPLMTPEPRWESFGRVFEGRQGMRDLMELAAGAYEPGSTRRELHDVIVQDQRVAVRCTTHARTRKGEDYNNAYAYFFELRGGKVDRVHELYDSAYAATRFASE